MVHKRRLRPFFRNVNQLYWQKRFQKEASTLNWISFIKYEVMFILWLIFAMDLKPGNPSGVNKRHKC